MMKRQVQILGVACCAALLLTPAAHATDAEVRGPLDAEALVKRFVLVMPTPDFTTPERLALLGFRYGLSGLCGLPASFAGMPNPPDRDESASISAGLRYAGEFLDDHEGCQSWQARELRARLSIWTKEAGIE